MKKSLDPYKIINRYYPEGSLAKKILIIHSELVSEKALKLAKQVKHLAPDEDFIWEAAMLHDIGIFLTHAPKIGCLGKEPYICHGILGRALLEDEGLLKHALVCERHTGTGITREDIKTQSLPLPDRDMRPISLEEQIICYADKFFSKNPIKLKKEKSINKVLKSAGKFGDDKKKRIEEWMALFGT